MTFQETPLAELSAEDTPIVRTEIPGPKSIEQWNRQAALSSPGLSAAATITHLCMDEGYGALVRDADGNVFIDFCAGTVVNVTGHNHPRVVSRIQEELERFIHIYDFLTPVRAEFFEALKECLPDNLSQYQMYTSGGETVEAAMRVATAASGGKYEFISLYRAFHGKTAGVRSLMGGAYKKGFGPSLAGHVQTANAYCYRCPIGREYPSCGAACADMIEDVYQQQTTGAVAAVVMEPIQGAGGVIVPPSEFVEKIRAFCDRNGLLLIMDEVLTAAGRTGKLWAHEHFDVRPDIMTMGKGIGSGFPLSILAASPDLMNSAPFNQPNGASTTFGGGPLAAAAGLATLQVLADESLVEQGARVGAHIKSRLQEIQKRHPIIGDVRGEGMLIGVEWVRNPDTKEPLDLDICNELYKEVVGRGVLLVTNAQIWRITPPLVMTEALADRALDLMEEAIEAVEKRFSL